MGYLAIVGMVAIMCGLVLVVITRSIVRGSPPGTSAGIGAVMYIGLPGIFVLLTGIGAVLVGFSLDAKTAAGVVISFPLVAFILWRIVRYFSVG